jgi:hypothetical protein
MTFIPILWERLHKMNTSETRHRFCCKKLGLFPQHSFGKLIEERLKTRKGYKPNSVGSYAIFTRLYKKVCTETSFCR